MTDTVTSQNIDLSSWDTVHSDSLSGLLMLRYYLCNSELYFKYRKCEN
jgi:hypothetical protein